ncbi:MAG: EamA family transporter [Chloroflexi bacterium]|nr:MAG: EamA family transporter [Chloroflexota bacterium]
MSSPSPRISGVWFILLASVLWGTTGTAQTFAPAGTSPLAIGTMRMVIGGAFLVALMLVRGGWRKSGPWPIVPLIFTVLGVVGYQLLFFAAVVRAGVALGTIAGIGSSPILAGLFTWVLFRKWPGRQWVIATSLAIVGCTLLIGGGQSIEIDIGGILLAIGAGAAYAVYTIASKFLVGERPSIVVAGVVFGLGALFMLPLGFVLDMSWLAEPGGFLVALHLGLVTLAAAYLLFTIGLKTVSSATAVSLTLAEPLTAAVLGTFVVGESLELLAWLGIGLLFAGLVVLTWRRE